MATKTIPESSQTEAGRDKEIAPMPTSAVDPVAANPFNPEEFITADQPTLSVGTVLTKLKVGKPGKQDFFRIHPELSFPAYFIKDEHDGEMFLIHPDLAGLYQDSVRHMQVYFWISNQPNVAGVWPVALPDANGNLNDWPASAHAVCKAAIAEWIKVQSNMSAGCYQIGMPTSQDVFDGKDEWPEQITSVSELLALAFKDHVITSNDHALLKKIRGEV